MKVTYLIGAGASFNAMPLVEQIPKRLEDLILWLKSEDHQLDKDNSYFDHPQISSKKTKFQHQEILIKDLIELRSQAMRGNTVDELAKKLKNNTTELTKIKVLISILFTWCQLENNFDRRYDRWLAAHTGQSHLNLPPNVVFLSWNYDHQFEMAYTEHTKNKSIDWSVKNLNVVTRHSTNSQLNQKTGFGVYKLNGSTSILDETKQNELFFLQHFQHRLDKKMVEYFVGQYAQLLQYRPEYFSLSFGWDDQNDLFMAEVRRAIAGTMILIVIGYSFPQINIETDRKLLKGMNSLKTIYVQDTKPEKVIPRIQATLQQWSNIAIVPHSDCDRFMNVNDAPLVMA
jgi:hypothetical protein